VLSITSPAPGAVLSGRSVTLNASATDVSGVKAVEFHVDNRLLATDTSAPYSANWNLRKAAKGAHTIRVRAVDLLGNASEQTLSVTVQ
jgi:large repetitive protein